MLLNIIQTSLPNKKVFYHRHQCVKCKKCGIYGSITYLNKYEGTKFVCKDCQSDGFQQIPLPKKTIFRKKYECMQCKKLGNKGILTYCPRCEEAEFVCPICHTYYHETINPSQFKHDPMR